ncbi:hypothetical protein D9M71_742640 [compost metagenome]
MPGISRQTLGSEVGSFGSWPAMVDSMNSASRALRVIGPIWSRLAASLKAPWRLTRPQVGFRPVRPLAAQGKRIEPPVSLPSEA